MAGNIVNSPTPMISTESVPYLTAVSVKLGGQPGAFGLPDDAVYKAIIRSASRTNASPGKMFGAG